jgi:hypothetical protein
MGLLSAVQFIQWLRQDASGEKFLIPTAATDTASGVGRPRVITGEIEKLLVRHIDREKHDINRRAIHMDRKYGDFCTDSDALRSFMLRQYARRLRANGLEAAEADRRAHEFAGTPTFARRFRSNKIALSRARRHLKSS